MMLFPAGIHEDIRASYVFAAALKATLENAGKSDEAQKWLQILRERDMPEDVVERVQSGGPPPAPTTVGTN